MKKLYILKIGGSVITYKNQKTARLRKNLIVQIAREIKKSSAKNNFDLIIIHGAGSTGHRIAHEYGLAHGANSTTRGREGSMLCRLANQKMNLEIVKIFNQEKLPIVSLHTASALTQENKIIKNFNLEIIKETLKQNYWPLLYGEMVIDKKLGMTICSGDDIAPYLAKNLRVEKIFYATDVDGIFNDDPYKNKKTTLIKKAKLSQIKNQTKLSSSHNLDVTGGLKSKTEKLFSLINSKCKTAEIFNGHEPKNFLDIFSNKDFPHTTIFLK